MPAAIRHEDFCSTAHRNLHIKGEHSVSSLPPYFDPSERRILGSLDPCDGINDLRPYDYIPVARFPLIRIDACKCLIEPASDSVITVVDMASAAVPVLPGKVCSIVKHIEISRIVAFLEHIVDKTGLAFSCCPLGNNIGIDIDLEERESSVGSFNVDIYAVESGTGRKIIIENQLEDTNHDHLGKLITYASGKGAEVIVWIVKRARDEHRQAIEWLNQHTDSNIGFFWLRLNCGKLMILFWPQNSMSLKNRMIGLKL